MLDPQKRAYFHVFPSLRHDPFVRCDDHGHHIDACGSGHHIFDEFLMARDIDDPQVSATGQIQRCKSELNGNAPQLLLLEPIRVGAGYRLDEAGLTMIDMPGCPENNLFHVIIKPFYVLGFSCLTICKLVPICHT